jgi:DNA-binding XRE family transcriptional regulator
MLCVTLTLANTVPAASAERTVEQLVNSLSARPDAVGGEAAGFKARGSRQVQGYLATADETVGLVLSIARSAEWGVHLTLIPNSVSEYLDASKSSWFECAFSRAAEAGAGTLRAPGGVKVELLREGGLVGSKHAPEIGPIESTLQLLCAIERRRSDEGQEAGVMINAGRSQTEAAQLLGVSQQAISSRLQAGYWYESRKVAYWLAVQIEQLTTP